MTPTLTLKPQFSLADRIGSPWAAYAAATASGLLLSVSFGMHPPWWAAWLAPAPLLVGALTGPPQRAFRLGAVAGLISALGVLGQWAMFLGWPLTLVMVLARGFFWGGVIRLAADSARRGPAWAAALCAPAMAAGIETLVQTVSPHGSYGSLAYSQSALVLVQQVAALGGPSAITFVLMTGGVSLGLVAARLAGAPIAGTRLAVAAGTGFMIAAAALGWGAWRLGHAQAAPSVPAALVATDRFPGEPDDWDPIWRAYAPAIAATASPGGVVVAPEKLALVSPAKAAQVAGEVGQLAKAHLATIVLGVEVGDPRAGYANRALIAGPDGLTRWYDKQRLNPGMEDRDRPGRLVTTWLMGSARLGVAVCKDMHFPQLGRAYGRAGSGLMLVPAWDFGFDGWLNDRLSALRGVESGFSVARAARQGVLSLTDRYGRVVAEAATQGAAMVTVRGRLPAAAGTTVYDRVGDLFGWVCVAVAFLALAWQGRARRADAAA